MLYDVPENREKWPSHFSTAQGDIFKCPALPNKTPKLLYLQYETEKMCF